MSKRIGQVLIERGLLTRGQLEAALQSQLIHGGHLGTTLLELGFVDEAALGRTLSQILGLRHASAEVFEDVPKSILDVLPRDFVRRRHVIPIGLEGGSLHVAVVDRRSLANISTMTGYKVVPYVAPEFRILAAMERYYGIPRRARFLRVSPASLPGQPGRAAGSKRDERPPAQSAAATATIVAAVDPCAPAEALPPEIVELSQRLGQAVTHWELGETVLEFASRRLPRCVLFGVDGDQAAVVSWKGIEIDVRTVRDQPIAVTADSLFGLVLDEACYRGTLPTEIDFAPFYRRLGIEPPREILVLPIYGDERLEAVLYGDGGVDGCIDEPLEAYQLASERIALALRMLALKTQLCAP